MKETILVNKKDFKRHLKSIGGNKRHELLIDFRRAFDRGEKTLSIKSTAQFDYIINLDADNHFAIQAFFKPITGKIGRGVGH